MGRVYAASDIFLFPTIFDPFPLATLEALSAGLPVITSASNGVSEIMTPGLHGEVIAEPSDVMALGSALSKWLEITGDPIRADRVREDCSALASEFTLERNLRETWDVIQKLVIQRK
jgi:UDP-glucose:(heptosyl)LPS alpha-1,3-glucosyltransferase